MGRAGAALLVLLAFARPALATEWVICKAQGKHGPEVRILLGAMNVIAVSRVDMSVASQSWSTDPTVEGAGASRIMVGQAFEDGDSLKLDLTDEGMGRIVAQLRLMKAGEGDMVAMGGTLTVAGQGAWAVVCDGP